MQDDLTISKGSPGHPGLDYRMLREEGIRRIRELAASWTDHNSHDPGITLLELLSYGITDLSYRAGFSVEDLLASDPDNKIGSSPEFYFAGEIFPNHPFTLGDFRKVLIDRPEVRQAWIRMLDGTEQKVCFDREKRRLTYEQTDEKINIRGLLEALIELTPDENAGDLNSNTLSREITLSNSEGTRKFQVGLAFPWFDEMHSAWKSTLSISKVTVTLDRIADGHPDGNQYRAKVKVKMSAPEMTDTFFVLIRVTSAEGGLTGFKMLLEGELVDVLKDTSAGSPLTTYAERLALASERLGVMMDLLRSIRNLGEDFGKISPVRIQEIAVAGSAEVPFDADPEQWLARAYFDLKNHIDPPVVFHNLQDMLSRGISPEEFFEGPPLEHGFLLDEELISLKGRESIFVSDLLQILMDNSAGSPIAIKGLQIRDIISNDIIVDWNGNCLPLHEPMVYKPRLSLAESNLVLTRRGIVVQIDQVRLSQLYQELVEASEPDKSAAAQKSLTIPRGDDRHTGDYFSLQEDLPMTYGTGSEGLPDDVLALRKAQARQLKGFLLHFDQLFAQFLAQVSQLKNIFSIDPGVERTYFTQAVYQVPGAMRLLREFIAVQPDLDDDSALDIAWAAFRSDDSNPYMTGLEELTEKEDLFLSRRNRFLDHLISRFGEDFTDYSMSVIAAGQQKVPQSLIGEKTTFLGEVPLLGSQRGKGFDLTTGADTWNTVNVTGLERRLGRMLGFSDISRKFLTAGDFSFIEFYQEEDTDELDEYRFRIRDENGKILLSGTRAYKVLEDGYDIVAQVLEDGKATTNYKVLTAIDGQFHFNLYNEQDDIIARRIDLFPTEEEAITLLNETADFLATHFEGINDPPSEGMHIVEHLLLRPLLRETIDGKKYEDTLMPVIPDDFGEITTEGLDPYSFRITVILPAQLELFASEEFRSLADRLARLETPAHLMPEVFFLENIPLSRFEQAWKQWLEMAVTPLPTDEDDLDEYKKLRHKALHRLIAAMQFVPKLPAV